MVKFSVAYKANDKVFTKVGIDEIPVPAGSSIIKLDVVEIAEDGDVALFDEVVKLRVRVKELGTTLYWARHHSGMEKWLEILTDAQEKGFPG